MSRRLKEWEERIVPRLEEEVSTGQSAAVKGQTRFYQSSAVTKSLGVRLTSMVAALYLVKHAVMGLDVVQRYSCPRSSTALNLAAARYPFHRRRGLHLTFTSTVARFSPKCQRTASVRERVLLRVRRILGMCGTCFTTCLPAPSLTPMPLQSLSV